MLCDAIPMTRDEEQKTRQDVKMHMQADGQSVCVNAGAMCKKFRDHEMTIQEMSEQRENLRDT